MNVHTTENKYKKENIYFQVADFQMFDNLRYLELGRGCRPEKQHRKRFCCFVEVQIKLHFSSKNSIVNTHFDLLDHFQITDL